MKNTRHTSTIRNAIMLICILVSGRSYSQCSGCTSTVNGNSAITVLPGQVVCLTFAGSYNKIITISGGTLCISSATTMAGTFIISGADTIINNGTVSTAIPLGSSSVLTNNGAAIISGVITSSTGSKIINSGIISNASAMTVNGIITNNSGGSISTPLTIPSGITLGNSGTISGAITINNGGTVTNNTTGLITGTSSVSGTLTNNGSITNNIALTATGALTNNLTISANITAMPSGASFNNSSTGTYSGSVTSSLGSAISNSGTLTNSGGTIAGSFTTVSGSGTTNTGTINQTFTLNGTLSNSGTLSAGLTVANNSTVTNNGTIGSTITINNGGTLINNHALAGNIAMATGSTFSNYSAYTGSLAQSGGSLTNYSGGTLTPAATSTYTGGTLTNNSGAAVTLPNATTTLATGYTFTNNGTLNETHTLTVSAGASLYLDGTQSMAGSIVADNGTIYLAGNLTVGTFSGGGTFNETQSGCNTFIATTNTFSGTFNGGQSSYNSGLIVNVASSGSPTYTNGASVTLAVPTQQPTGLSLGISALTVSGSFSSPSPGTNISGYIVLRYIGIAAPADNPTTSTYYPVGTVIGSSTVVALISGGSGSKNFTDNIPSGGCGKNAYYRIFSYDGAGECESFYLTSPLIGSIALPAIPSAVISPSGPSTICVSGALTASGGGAYQWNATAGSATTAAITASASGTYAVTVTSAAGCTASASNVVTVDPSISDTAWVTNVTFYGGNNGAAYNTPSGGTGPFIYLWSNASTLQSISYLTQGTYTVTVTDALSCTISKTVTVTQPAQVASSDLDPVTANIQTAPIGSYVIAMDSANQSLSGYFNIKAYGLITTLLNNKIALNWVIKTGKTKDAVDFSASSTEVFPAFAASSMRNFKAGPFVIFPQDTVNGNIHTIINAFNAANPSNQVKVYQLTAATTVDVRYVLTAAPKAAILNDGGNANIHVGYMTLASVPVGNYYVLSSAVYLVDSCYNFASEPHNSNPETAVLDSLKQYVVAGGNVLYQCHAIWNYEDSAYFQTTTGINVSNTSGSIAYSHPDLTFQQYEGSFDPTAVGGSFQNWTLNSGGALTNNTQVFQSGTGANSGIIGQSMAKLGSGTGHLVFFTGGHDYGATNNVDKINGMRSYFNAMLTPCTVKNCNSLRWDNDLVVSETMSACNLYLGQKDTFVMVVANNGPSTVAATGVTVNRVLPASQTYLSSIAGKGSYNSSTGVWTVGNMSLNESDTLTVIVSANAAGSFSNTVYITRNLYDFYQSNDTAKLSGTIYVCSANAGPDINHCSDSVFTMAGTTPCSGTAIWSVLSGTATIVSSGSPTSTVYVSVGNTATLLYTITNGCANSIDTIILHSYVSPTATITPSGATTFCSPGSVILTASGSGTYSWSTGATTAPITATNSATYRVTVTNTFSCTATASVVVVAASCRTISGWIFDDANGNGIVDGADTKTSLGKTLYSVLSDTTGKVVSTGLIGADGSFSLGPVLPGTNGFRTYMSTTNPSIGSFASGNSWPTGWVGTLGQYGSHNLAGSGVDTATSEIIAVNTDTFNVTNILIGYDQLPYTASQSYTISHPALNSSKKLISINGMGPIGGTDPEDGSYSTGRTFIINSLAGMNGNQLFYDANGDGTLQSYEQITGYTVITSYDPNKLSVKFTGAKAVNTVFNYLTTDAGGKSSLSPSNYTINWAVALPVKLEYFTAQGDNNISMLKWVTASEINNDHFEIERSADALQWDKIDEVKGAGNSNDNIDYSTVDEHPLKGVNYYRLKQVDVDGHFDYSDIAEVEFGPGQHSTTIMTIYPNPLPAGKPLNIALAGTSDDIKHVSITNAMGQQVYKYDPSDEQGYKLSGLTLPTGTYVIHVLSSSNESFSSKIVFQ